MAHPRLADTFPLDASHHPSPDCSNAEDTPPDDSKLRKLRLRKARFQGTRLPSTHQRTSSSPPSPTATHNILDSSPLSAPMRSPRRPSTSMAVGSNALQELNAGSVRRRNNHSRDLSVPVLSDSPAIDENSASPNQYDHRHRRSSIPVKVSRQNGARLSNGSRRSVSGGESKYIEHLESQLAAMQTQLQSLTSPSSTRTQSAKLRAMNSEAKLLRQEIADWEQKFNERLQEQMEQNDIVTSSLRGHIRALERSADETRAKLTETLLESDAKSKSLEAVESANYELERRVEFLSELLATSPNKIDLHTSDGESRPLRPRSIPPARLFSPDRSKRLSTHTNSVSTPGSQAGRRDSRASLSSAFSSDPVLSSAAQSEGVPSHYSQIDESDGGESPTLIESSQASSQRFSWMRPKADAQSSSRPTRRMRRFYTGALGPRALILPSTTHAGSLPASAHSPSTPCPSQGHGLNRHSLSHFHVPLLSPTSARRPAAHRRSATWDEDDTSLRQNRHAAPFSFIPPLSAVPPGISGVDQSDEAGHSEQRQLHSFGPTQGKNLFDEIGHMRFDSSSDSGGSLPGTAVKHRGSPSEVSTTSTSPPIPSLLSPDGAAAVVDHDTTLEPASPHRTLFAKSPHSDPDSTSVCTNINNTPLAALARQPSAVFNIISTLFSRSLYLYTSSARNVINNAWSATSLSRPVVEFRWWLVRILIGGMRRKGMLLDRTKHGPRAMSSGLGLGLASTVLLPQHPPRKAREADVGAGLLSGDPGPSRLSSAQTIVPVHVPAQQSFRKADTNSSGSVATWLRFSVTLLFAVGMAIKDGPGSLLDEERGGMIMQSEEEDLGDDYDDDDDWFDDLDDEGVDGWKKIVLSRGLH